MKKKKNELLNFAFDKQNAGSDFDIDIDNVSTTIGINKVNYIYNNIKTLKYVCHLTEYDVNDLKIKLNIIADYLTEYLFGKVNYNKLYEKITYNITNVIDYLENKNGIRDKRQKDQLNNLIKKQKPYGTLDEHWEELMYLFETKTFYAKKWKSIFNKMIKNLKKGRYAFYNSQTKMDKIFSELGIEFIEDFVKACKKCEE